MYSYGSDLPRIHLPCSPQIEIPPDLSDPSLQQLLLHIPKQRFIKLVRESNLDSKSEYSENCRKVKLPFFNLSIENSMALPYHLGLIFYRFEIGKFMFVDQRRIRLLDNRWFRKIKHIEVEFPEDHLDKYIGKLQCTHLNIACKFPFDVETVLEFMESVETLFCLDMYELQAKCSDKALDKIIEKSKLGNGIKTLVIKTSPESTLTCAGITRLIKESRWKYYFGRCRIQFCFVRGSAENLFDSLVEMCRTHFMFKEVVRYPYNASFTITTESHKEIQLFIQNFKS